ncbi:hypothetical protein HanRHA438_Chr03g0108661 [Helianthus annuus]|nr:hypothetical protein HanRHA438_Chr03g0108661 [Helianthus annuus]
MLISHFLLRLNHVSSLLFQQPTLLQFRKVSDFQKNRINDVIYIRTTTFSYSHSRYLSHYLRCNITPP